MDVAGELSKLTGCEVKATNDANAAALGEIWMGAAADYNSAVMITLGTGVGGGSLLMERSSMEVVDMVERSVI